MRVPPPGAGRCPARAPAAAYGGCPRGDAQPEIPMRSRPARAFDADSPSREAEDACIRRVEIGA